LVLQDTPLNDFALEKTLRNSVSAVDNLSDKDEEKLERMRVRFTRVDQFLDYLEREEDFERKQFGLDRLRSAVARPITRIITNSYYEQKSWIEQRIRENREKFAEENLFKPQEGEFGESDCEMDVPGRNETDRDL
jgi:hypothetical protein